MIQINYNSTMPKVSLCQIHIQPAEIDQNLSRALQALEEAVQQGGNLALLPELWSSGYDLPHSAAQARRSPEILALLAHFSQEHRIAIGGSLLEQVGSQVFNIFTLFQPDQPPVKYRKIHLFRLMDEDAWLAPGNEPVTADFGGLKTGLSICYDLRFPELYRLYALQQVQLFLISAEWPTRRVEHWRTLLRARAIENQAFVAAVNTVGNSGGATYGGSSAVISPWGEALIEAPADEEAVLTVELDLQQLADVRRFMPVFSDRRPEIYSRPPDAD